MSELLISNHDGIVPSSFDELENLPGVGHKTAPVIMSQAFNVPAFPVDTHIHRLARRWKLSSGKCKNKKDLKVLIKKIIKNSSTIIFFRREFCQARKKECQCIICSKV